MPVTRDDLVEALKIARTIPNNAIEKRLADRFGEEIIETSNGFTITIDVKHNDLFGPINERNP
jgi:hypothetical protein